MGAPDVEPLEKDLVARIAGRVTARTFAKNAIIVTEGDDTDSLYVLLSGRVKVFVSGEDGGEFEVNRIGPGAYFGEVVLDGGPRSASVIALEACRCAIVRRADLARFMVDFPEFSAHLVRTLARRVRQLTATVRDLALMDVYGRVARLLLDLAEDMEGKLVIPEKLTQKDIAQRVGCSREMVSRIFTDLTAGGYIRKEGGRIVVTRKPPSHW